ncbi:uncharacterized protein SRS1_14197 [Sporisorium reilianum f. sp. reilianum]|uniref:Uncharacterized protein n=1 Tax=Sporisorium reilianum f. sp. reilianum TaxID=72559 RepID=A0A2N8UF71_9BASI|nr:uncharacterized protein SRS1_14197 [Sporisorium reilianum f. sp. reilianum]
MHLVGDLVRAVSMAVSVVLVSTSVIRCAPPVSVEDLSKLTTSFRPAKSSELHDLRTASPPNAVPDELWNTGLGADLVGETRNGRLVFGYPKFHEIAYYIPSKHHGYSESLVADYPSQTIRSYGWTQTIRWDKAPNLRLYPHGSVPVKEPLPNRNIAIKLGEDRYLLADDVPLGGVSVRKAPWFSESVTEHKKTKGKEGPELTKEDFAPLGLTYRVDHVDDAYRGPERGYPAEGTST